MYELYAQLEPLIIKIQLITAMFGMGCVMGLADFLKIVRHPSGVALGVGTQWLVVPFIGQAFVWAFDLGPGWAIGLLILTAIPGGAFSNLLTFLARGHTPLSIAITLVSTLCCIFSAPILLKIFAGSHVPADFHFPVGRVIYEVLLYLVVPLGLGMLVCHFIPGRSPLVSKVAIWASMGFVSLLAVGALGTGKIQVAQYGWTPPLMLLLFGLVIHLASMEFFHAVGRTDDEVVAIGIEVSVRNGGVGLLLAGFFFIDPATGKHLPEYYKIIYTILFYVGVQIIIPLPILFRHRFGRSPLPFRRPRRPPPAPSNVEQPSQP
ncbi:MAG: bile acid:sodium symporter family protein [Polyangia bacterium]|mgnify:CR=1 FL=1|nr:bile acid:sodium symporter family protein [Polyangia bacterium]